MLPPVPESRFGYTFGRMLGSDNYLELSSFESPGEMDYNSINRRRFVNALSFSGFYGVMADYVKARLGAGIIRVELTDFAIYTAIDEALTLLDYHCPAWTTQFMTFTTQAGVNMYKLPKFVLNNLQYVVYKKNLLTIASQGGTLEFDFFIKYFQENMLFQDFAVGEFLLLQMSLEQMRKVLGREGAFQVINNEYLYVSPTPYSSDQEEVIVEFRCLDTNTLHPFYINWLQRYSLAICKGILGTIRGKHKRLPGPDGGTELDGPELKQESAAEKAALKDELLNEIEEPPTPFTLF
jgi:hypothetical protein